MVRTFFLLLFLPVAYSVSAQHDTYILRNMDYGKKVGPAVPPRAVYVPKPTPGLRTSVKVKYPTLPLRLYMEGVVWMIFDIGSDGLPKSVECERIDSLVISETDKKKVAKYADDGKKALVDEAKRAIYLLRLAPADSVRHYRVPIHYKIN